MEMSKFKKAVLGIVLGAIIGILNILPMFFQRINWDVNLSTFLTWTIVGFFISTTNLKFQGFIKGSMISILIFIPSIIFVIESNLLGVIWIIVMALIYGSLLGYLIDKFSKD